MADLSTVGIVILAAGSSRRLGRPKQLLELDGRPLLQHVVDAAGAADAGEIVVVLGHEAEAVERRIALPAGARVVLNPDHSSGQASSLRAGVQALSDGIARAVVLLGDQPAVTAAAIHAVAEGAGPIRRARYRGTPGHPVAFDRGIWPELVAIDGDRGARDLIARRGEVVVDVDVDSAAPVDVDTEEDARAAGAL